MQNVEVFSTVRLYYTYMLYIDVLLDFCFIVFASWEGGLPGGGG